MQPDPSSGTVEVLQQILLTLQSSHNSSFAEPAASLFKPTASAVRVNSFWIAALVVSVSAAFLAILAKQWLFSISKGLAPTLEMRGRQHQYRHDNLQSWRLESIISALPILLHISLLLFFAGLIDYFWSINTTVAAVAASFVSAMVFVYVLTHVTSLLTPTCPYRTSVTSVIFACLNWSLREIAADLTGIGMIAFLHVLTFMGWRRGWDRSPENLELYDYIMETFTHPGKWRKEAKAMWSIYLTKYSTARYWEDRYISKHSDLVDARALARAIKRFPRTERSPQLLAEALSRFGGLVKHRGILIHSSAIELLTYQLRSVYPGQLAKVDPDQRDSVKRQFAALARLLTETDANDSRTRGVTHGIPVHQDAEMTNLFEDDNGVGALAASGLCVPDAAVTDKDDIVFFSNFLRLQITASSDCWYWRDVRGSLLEFYQRLRDGHDIADLGDDELLTVVNAMLFTAMNPAYTLVWRSRMQGLTSLQAEFNIEALDVVAAVMLNRPDMSLAVRRQLCYGIWFFSSPSPWAAGGTLVPIIESTKELSMALSAALSLDSSHRSGIYAVLVMLETSLYSPPQTNATLAEKEDFSHLVATLAARYPLFLQEFSAGLQKQPPEWTSLSRLLKRIVRISGYLSFYQDDAPGGPLKIDREQIMHDTLEILIYACGHLEGFPVEDRPMISRLAFGTACRTAMLQAMEDSHVSDPGPSSRAFLFDDVTSETLAGTFVTALQSSSKVPGNTIRTVLAMLSLLSKQTSSDDNAVQLEVLEHLCDSRIEVESLLISLTEGVYGTEAIGALEAVRNMYDAGSSLHRTTADAAFLV